MMGRILCFLGLHSWTEPRYRDDSSGSAYMRRGRGEPFVCRRCRARHRRWVA
jgi:hypothetical protein